MPSLGRDSKAGGQVFERKDNHPKVNAWMWLALSYIFIETMHAPYFTGFQLRTNQEISPWQLEYTTIPSARTSRAKQIPSSDSLDGSSSGQPTKNTPNRERAGSTKNIDKISPFESR